MFVYFNNNPRGDTKAGDCVIRAISAVTGESWEKIYVDLCAEGFDYGDWGNNNAVWDIYLRKRGFKRYICPDSCSYCYSIADFANEYNTGKYLAATGSHVVAIISGDFYDTFDSGNASVIYYYTKEGE